jgi:hypothetical protein
MDRTGGITRAGIFRAGVVALLVALLTALTGACSTEPDDPDDDLAAMRAAETAGSPASAWYDDYPAATVTLVEGADPTTAVRTLYGGEAVQSESLDAARSTAGADREWVAAGRIGDWTFVWEDNGWQGSDVDKAAALSRGTRLVSAFWNVNELAVATVADDGQVTRQFDPESRTNPANAVGTPLPDEDWLDWDHDWIGSLLRLQSRLTGERIADPSWLRQPTVRFWTHPTDSE